MKKLSIVKKIVIFVVFFVVFVISLFSFGLPSLYFIEQFLLIEKIFNCGGEPCLLYGIIVGSSINALIGGVITYFLLKKRL